MARTAPDRKRTRDPLDAETLRAFALRYVARYATSSARLGDYLDRKLAQRGWAGDGEPPVAEIVARCVESGMIDDAAFAAARVRSLARAGYGARRRDLALRAGGIDADGRAGAERALAGEGEDDPAWASALAYARRRRFGPFAAVLADRDGQRRAIAALIRAGHSYDVSRRVVALPPGADGDAAGPA